MDPIPQNLDELYFERGGPIQRLAQRLFTRWGANHSLGTRILGFLAITWLPLVALASLEGRALGASPQESLLLDFGTYARFFLTVPNSPHAPFGTSLAALWYRLIAVPILQFFWYRWLWRLLVWAGFLWSISRLDLNLVGTHADQAGGLGFLGTAHTSLGILAVALSSVLSAEAAFLIVFQQAEIETFQVPFAAVLLFVELTFFGPLLFFTPILIRTRLTWLHDYGLLAYISQAGGIHRCIRSTPASG